jgi:hypothetical protein
VIFYVSRQATEATLDDGRPLLRGEEIDLSKQDQQNPFNARLIAEGQLLSIAHEYKAVEDAQKVVDDYLKNPAAPRVSAGTESGATPEGGTS